MPPFGDVTRSDSAFRAFLHGLPGVDQVGAEARVAVLGTRSIKTTAKAWAIDTAISMVDLTTLEGADTPGKVRCLAAKAKPPDPGDPTMPARSPPSASTATSPAWPARRWGAPASTSPPSPRRSRAAAPAAR